MTQAGTPDFTGTGAALAALVVFGIAYALVIAEEFIQLRKSKPVVVAAGLIWVLVAVAARARGGLDVAAALEDNLGEYAGLLLFLLAAMTYVNVLDERNVFAMLRSRMVAAGYSLRMVFWLTGLLAFCLSPVLDNLTTALVLGAVVLAVGRGEPRFLVPACVNLVVAANAGGAFSPFGDITTLMVWQEGLVKFHQFFVLFLPALANWLVPALCLQFAVPRAQPQPERGQARMKQGGGIVIALFALTIAGTVVLHQGLHLPAFLGMMSGLGLLMLYGYLIQRRERSFDLFAHVRRVEWDTLLFFYGVMLCLGGLAALGYLALLSQHSYAAFGPSATNIGVGVASAIIDNIPIMFAVLTMHPQMSHGQWLLVTLTAGVGGSLLSVGSAAGVALMGEARGVYTFMAHLKWIWAVALGYVASVWLHMLVNGALF
ncbi:MAG TPA: sodium:proton antiporter NhaD [Steroidobacteraceae bacterium]|nr:sodium:proton antiporter NhaD [Steroidobacteraceae bacterium]